MARTIPQRELRNDNARVIAAVAAGERFVITRNGEPVAELRPIEHHRRTVLPRAEVQALFASAPRIDRARFRADTDARIDPTLPR